MSWTKLSWTKLTCAATCASAIAGCAQVLGGLDEGATRAGETPVPGDGAGTDTGSSSAVVPRTDWLPGYGYRVAYEVNSNEPEPLLGYSLRLALDTRDVIRARRMRANGADLRVTRADGLTVVPHWIASALDAEATTLWAKVDLVPGRNVVFVYYGNDAAEQAASLRDTFLDGIIANPTFDGTTPWVAAPPTNGGAASLQIHEQRASAALSRDTGTVPSSLGWCQSVTFPPGRRYRIVFDVTAVQADRAEVAVWTGGAARTPVWLGASGSGLWRGIDTAVIEPGSTQLCLGGTALANARPQSLSVYFQNLRVRLYAASDPLAGPAGAEERR